MLRVLIDICLAILASLDRAFSDAMPELMCRLYNEIFYAIRRLDKMFFEHTLTLHIEAKKVPRAKRTEAKKEKQAYKKLEKGNWWVNPIKAQNHRKRAAINRTKKVLVRSLVELAKSPCSDDITIIKSRAEAEIPEFYALLNNIKSLPVCNIAGYIKHVPLNYPNNSQPEYIQFILERCFGTVDINMLMRPVYSQIVIEMLKEAFDEMNYAVALKLFTNQKLIGQIEAENIDLSEYKISAKHLQAKQTIVEVLTKLQNLPRNRAEESVAFTLVLEAAKYQGVRQQEKAVFLLQFILENHFENKNDYDFDSFIKKVEPEIQHTFILAFLKCEGVYEIRDFCRQNNTSIVGMLSHLAREWLKITLGDWRTIPMVFKIRGWHLTFNMLRCKYVYKAL
jgi:hypothetical protein